MCGTCVHTPPAYSNSTSLHSNRISTACVAGEVQYGVLATKGAGVQLHQTEVIGPSLAGVVLTGV